MDRYKLDYARIVENVKELRKAKGLSQLELSEKADLALNTISKFEMGQKQINLQTFIKIANALDVDVNFLLSCEAQEPKKQEMLINSLIKDFGSQDREMLVSIIAAIRARGI